MVRRQGFCVSHSFILLKRTPKVCGHNAFALKEAPTTHSLSSSLQSTIYNPSILQSPLLFFSLYLVIFNVVGYPNTPTGSFGVMVNNNEQQITKLSTSSLTFPLWSGTVVGLSGSSLTSYKYVQLDGSGQPIKTETFQRTLQNPQLLSTENEFFEREITRSNLPYVPLVYDPWPMSKTKIFDDTQVATIHLMTIGEGGQAQFEDMLMNPMPEKSIEVDFRYINHKLVHNAQNITFKLSGKSSMEFNKMAFKLKFDTKGKRQLGGAFQAQHFFSRPSIKLRSETTDPVSQVFFSSPVFVQIP